MTLANKIRTHVIAHHFGPARQRGARTIELRAGDIHHELGLTARLPAVCSVLGGGKLCEEAEMILTGRTGPSQGANVWFTYQLEHSASSACASPPQQEVEERGAQTGGRRAPWGADTLDLPGALILVSCTKSKQRGDALARDLYSSTFFVRARSWIARRGADWRILSAKNGLLAPDTRISPYEFTLNRLGVAERRRWAECVLADLTPLATGYPGVIFLAGQQYREFLLPALEAKGIPCSAPMAHLAQGEQLAWLGAP